MSEKDINRYICIFTGFYLPHLGGVENYTYNLSKYLAKNGYKILIITSNFNNDSSSINNISGDITIVKLPVFNMFCNRYPIIKKNSTYHKLINSLANYNIKKIIINTRFYMISHVGASYGKKHHIPVFLIEHGSNYITLNNKLIDFFANRYEDILTSIIKPKITAFYGVSKGAANWLNNFGIKARGVWYNSIDTEQQLPDKIVHDGINFLYAGRIIKQKGVEDILSSFMHLNKTYKNIKLYIAGDGEDLSKFKDKYTSENILYLGKLDKLNMIHYYSLCDIFLFPTRYPEGLPTTILESGLMQCAFIGTDIDVIREIIENNVNGLLITNETTLVKNMEVLINNKDKIKNLANALQNTVINNFSWNHTISTIIKDINNY